MWLYAQSTDAFGYHRGNPYWALASGLSVPDEHERQYPLAAWWNVGDTLRIEFFPGIYGGSPWLEFHLADGGPGYLTILDTAMTQIDGVPVGGWKVIDREPVTAKQYRCPKESQGLVERGLHNQEIIDRLAGEQE